MEREQLEQEIRKIEAETKMVQQQKKDEIEAEETLKVAPLLEQASKLKNEIAKAAFHKYADKFTALTEKRLELTKKLDLIKIQTAKNIWYPEGTIVHLWEYSGSSWSRSRPLEKTDKTGIVVIYDGTQTLANVSNYNLPKKGDIIVIHRKKDGSIGLKFDIISRGGSVLGYTANWYADGDTPKDNIRTRKEEITEDSL